MSRALEVAVTRSVECGLGLAGSILGIRLAAALRTAPVWLLSAFDGTEIAEGRFGPVALLPADAHWALHAVQAFAPFLLLAVGFAAAAILAWKLSGLGSLVVACAGFWFAVPLASELFRFARGRRGSLELLLQSAGLPQGGEAVHIAVALAAGIALVWAVRPGIRRSGMLAVTTLAVPVLILHFAWDDARSGSLFPQRLGFDYIAPALAAVCAFVAWHPPVNPRMPTALGGGLLVTAGLLAAVAPLPWREASTADVDWSEQSSVGWTIRFETAHFSESDRVRWLQEVGERTRSYREKLGIGTSVKPLQAYVAASDAAMRSVVSDRSAAESFAWDGPERAVIRAGPDGLPEDVRIEALLAMRLAWGTPGSQTVALALARFATGTDDGNGLRDAAARIACEERQYSAAEVLDASGTFLSPIVRDLAGGAWISNLVEREGTATLRTLYGWSTAQAVEACPGCVPACDPSLVPAERPRRPESGFLKGVSFSHEVDRTGGYGSATASAQLARIAALGANAVALVPYAFTGAPEDASIRFRTLETDARLARAARHAREAGLMILLKPHLWSGARFHGEIAFESEERFERWFDDYRRWMLHYARLAEVHGFEALSIGNELAGLTRHESHWKDLIASVRRVYRGPLTYSAHWEEEFERIGFWGDLDWIGLNFYMPVSGQGAEPRPGTPEIEVAARAIDRVRARFGKPVLFTEVGFPALATAAARPWEENSSPLDRELQAACYGAWLERFAREPGVLGMFWWKWPSHGRGGPFDPSHSPLGKPALDVLEDWYGRL